MEVNCEGCAGCCLDWRPLLEDDERRGIDASEGDGRGHDPGDRCARPDDDRRREPLDGDPTFVPLTRDEVRTYLERGLAAALTPRFWRAADDDSGVEIDGHTVAAVAGRPVFFVGLRKVPKPVAPFDREEPAWLPTCVNLDPETLQCRVYDTDRFPDECGTYPEQTLALEQPTECERVESAFGGERLLAAGDADPDGLLFGPQALGAKLFAHPEPVRLEGIVADAAADELSADDRAECLAVAAASSPGTIAISDPHYEEGLERALAAIGDGDDGPADGEPTDNGPAADGDRPDDADEAWVGSAVREWIARYERANGTVPPPTVAREVEEDRGAPGTPGWGDLE